MITKEIIHFWHWDFYYLAFNVCQVNVCMCLYVLGSFCISRFPRLFEKSLMVFVPLNTLSSTLPSVPPPQFTPSSSIFPFLVWMWRKGPLSSLVVGIIR